MTITGLLKRATSAQAGVNRLVSMPLVSMPFVSMPHWHGPVWTNQRDDPRSRGHPAVADIRLVSGSWVTPLSAADQSVNFHACMSCTARGESG
jgi:hypothetical protein